jgi:chromate transporter
MEATKPSFTQSLPLWLKIGCIGFGGPSGQIAILHTEIVVQRGWINDQEFGRALQFCMLLPGPEAQQLATYIGWRLHGIRGGIAAGVLFFLPAAFFLWLLSLLYVMGQQWPLLHAFFDGLKPAVVAILLSACWRMGQRTLNSVRLGVIACSAFLLFCLHLSYPVVVLGFGLLGALLPELFSRSQEAMVENRDTENWRHSLRLALLILMIWTLPIVGLVLWLGTKALPVKIALFYGKVALFSFGGAYAALSYVALHAVNDWSWLSSGQMMDGLALAETTPGPLLIALQFVAFLAAYTTPGTLSPLCAATIGSLSAIWSLFLPSFLWIFTLAPHMERIARHRRMAGALRVIAAVVTAVIALLALSFAKNLFFPSAPQMQGITPRHVLSVAWLPLIIAALAFSLFHTKRLGIVPLILLSGGVGMLLKLGGQSFGL